MPQNWYGISKAKDEIEVSIYDEIGAYGVSAKDFIQEIQSYAGQHLHVRINSPGGSVIDGTAILNALTRHQGGVTVHIDAMAASMASVIAMAGVPTLMAENALLMIHNPWTIAAGDADELRKTAGLLDRLKDNIVGAYERKTKMAREEISELMNAETWLNALEAVALGFVDAIEPGVDAVAVASARSRFDTFRQSNLNDMAITPEKFKALETELAELKAAKATEIADAIKAALDPVNATLADVQAKLTAEKTRADEAVAKVAELTGELKSSADKLAISIADAAEKADALTKLEKSLGLHKATDAPDLKSAGGENPTLLDQFNAIQDPQARSEFYRTHQAALRKFLNR